MPVDARECGAEVGYLPFGSFPFRSQRYLPFIQSFKFRRGPLPKSGRYLRLLCDCVADLADRDCSRTKSGIFVQFRRGPLPKS
eukprot:4952973-Prymnesium_polylepis.1